MTRLFNSLIGLVVLVVTGAAPLQAEEIDRIVVIVNDDVITESEFNRQISNVKSDLRARNAKLPPERILRKQVLERMVNDKIQLQIAARSGVDVPDAMVDDAVRSLASRNNLTVDELERLLAGDGVPLASFRDNVKTQLTIRRLVEREIASRIAVTEEEIDSFLETQENQGTSASEFDISHILIRVSEGPGDAERGTAKQRAEQLVSELRGGLDFEQAAVANSEAPDALEGGRLGWRKPGQLPKLFMTALNGLEPGQVSDVLRSPNGFHILKLNDVRGQRSNQVEQTRARHILIAIDEFISLAEARARLMQLRERIGSGEEFADLAKAHSSDPLSSAQGGDLGWLAPGDAVRPFEQAMNRLEVGEISDPVRTPFGMHIIEVLERRTQEIGEELARNNARQQIHARKSDERYNRWLRQLRDESYVEYRQESLSFLN
ncbi:MAG: peptidylprolyl isomerase [Gammaproteobacteria bacterium]|nr:peptidylprolyl isomerase [Gammaproteobacteria bacterium]